MGGWALLRFVDARGAERATRTARAVRDELRRIERKFSRYIPDSIVSCINRDAGRTPVAVDDETLRLVTAALSLARATGGAFDPTSGVYRRAWSFSPAGRGGGRVPADSEIEALRPLVDHGAVRLRDATIFLPRAGMELDLGGVGKEYAADRAAACLQSHGIRSAIVNLAGDVRMIGSRGDGRPWSVGIVDPRRPGRIRFRVRCVGGAGVATSGDYERCIVVDGVRHHHLLDARTGRPARGVASCTVVAPTAFEAGLAATGAFLLGFDEGAAWLERSGLEGVLIGESGELRSTPGMSRLSDLPGSLYEDYPAI